MKVELTKEEAIALVTPLLVAVANARLDYEKAHARDNRVVMAMLERRIFALEKLLDATNAAL